MKEEIMHLAQNRFLYQTEHAAKFCFLTKTWD